MEISWDDRKAEANRLNHGVTFEEAATVITNPLALYNLNEHPTEIRYEVLGYSSLDRLIYVVTCDVSKTEIRIISARRATKRERKIYEKGI